MTRLAVISDLHHYSPLLGVSGRAYELRSGGNQTCLAESGAIIDTVFSELETSDVDAVLVAGDITNDGEKCSHEEIFEKLSRLNKTKPVYLITSTHDWCTDKNPRRFVGDKVYNDVETLSAKELSEKYLPFGEQTEIARFKNINGFYSRVFQLSDDLRLFALNVDGDGKNGASGYSDEHIEWVINQIEDAKKSGCSIIAMQHHLLLHGISFLVNQTQSISDNFLQAQRLADAGLRLMLTGHSHMQRTTEYVSSAGNKITQINIGALCGYPSPVTYMDIENSKAKVKTEFTVSFEYDGRKYTSDYFENHTAAVFLNILAAAVNDKKDFCERLKAQGININGIEKVYPVIKCCAKKINTVTLGSVGKLVNFVTLQKGVDKKALSEVKQIKLIDVVTDVFLCVFDGSLRAKKMSPELKKIFSDTGALPLRTAKKLPFKALKKESTVKLLGDIAFTAKELVYPSLPDNGECEIDLC